MFAVIIYDPLDPDFGSDFEEIAQISYDLLVTLGGRSDIVKLLKAGFDDKELARKWEACDDRHGLFVFYGHGTKNEFCAFGGLGPYIGTQDLEILSEYSIVYSVACFTIDGLGEDFIRSGGDKAYFGYHGLPRLWLTRGMNRGILNAANAGFWQMAVLRGNAQEAKEAVEDEYLKLQLAILRKQWDKEFVESCERLVCAEVVRGNRELFGLLGNPGIDLNIPE